MRALIVILGVLSGATTLSAQARAVTRGDTIQLSLAEARALALRANPELAAAQLDTAIARGQLSQARLPLRFNPTAEVLGAAGGKAAEPGVSQEIEIFAQRGARVSAARAAMDRAGAGVANAVRLTIGEVDRTFYRLASATRRSDLADEVLALNQRLADVAQRQLTEGQISRLESNLALVEFGRSRARAMSTRREREQVAVELRRLLGLPRDAAVRPLPDSVPKLAIPDSLLLVAPALRVPADSGPLIDIDRLTAVALARRPDLAERAAATRQANTEASLARREALPNLLARVVSEPRDDGTGRVIRPGVGLTLPIFNLNRGEVRARRAAARQADLERGAIAARVRAEIASAAATYHSATAEVEVLETTVLQPARQNRQLLEIAYREGKVGLPVLLLIRNQVIDAELEYWSAWLAAREALANLAEAAALNGPTTPSGPERRND